MVSQSTLQRIPTFLGFFLTFFFLVYIGKVGQFFLYFILAIALINEWLTLIKASKLHYFLMNLLLVILALLLGFNYESLAMISYPFVAFCIIVGTTFHSDMNYTSLLFFGAMWVTYMFSFIYLLCHISISASVIAIVLTEMSDTFQYVWGKLFGKHHPFPTLTPGKTAEGYVGGFITSIIIGMIICPKFLNVPLRTTPPESAVLAAICDIFINNPRLIHLAFGLIATIGGAFGGLILSSVKRRFNVKDAGFLLPGHGGFMDRLDALLVVGPLTYALVLLISGKGLQ